MSDSQKDFHKKLLGRLGESRAARYLKKHGYKILEKNYKLSFAEADIICLKDETVVFVEVKTRSNRDFSLPQDAVDRAKQKKYYSIADIYLKKKGWDKNYRFDIIEVVGKQVEHIIDAF